MKELTLDATLQNLSQVIVFVDDVLESAGCSMKAQAQIDIAIDELFSNIARYAYDSQTGQATVQVEIMSDPLTAMITLIDRGKPFNPLSKPDPDISLSSEERPFGGLGLLMVKNSMDSLTYEYIDGQNVLSFSKILV